MPAGQRDRWERRFNATQCENLGLEWDAAHLLCQFVDPVANIHKFGSRIFHVHAKDAFINRPLLETYGICHPGVPEHRWPGFDQQSRFSGTPGSLSYRLSVSPSHSFARATPQTGCAKMVSGARHSGPQHVRVARRR